MKLQHAPTCKFIPTGIVVYNAGTRYVLQQTAKPNYGDWYAMSTEDWAYRPIFRTQKFTPLVERLLRDKSSGWFTAPFTYAVYRTEYEYAQGTAIITHYTRVRGFAEFIRRA